MATDKNADDKTKLPLLDCPSRMYLIKYGTTIKSNGKKYKLPRTKNKHTTVNVIILALIILSAAIFITLLY